MRPLHRGLLVALLQCLIVLSVAGKFALDRERLPRVWVNVTPMDPGAWMHGRYLTLYLQVDVPEGYSGFLQTVRLQIVNGRLRAVPDAVRGRLTVNRYQQRPWILSEPVSFYIPEGAPDPAVRAPGEELWMEVSLPPNGMPRPVRLAVKSNGTLTPVSFRGPQGK
jgi:hypothetical protein